MLNILDVDRPAADEIVVAQAPGNHHDFVLDQQMPKFLEGLAKQADFHPRCIVIEYHADPVATLTHINDQTGHGRFAFGLAVLALAFCRLWRRLGNDITELAVRQVPRVKTNRVEGMAGQVQSQCLLLVVEEQPFLPFGQFRRLAVRDFDRGFGEAEHIVLTCRCCLGDLICTAQRLGDLVHHAAP